MKTIREGLTLGRFVAGIYDACGKNEATGIVQLALKTRLVQSRDPRLRRGTENPSTLRVLPDATATGTATAVRINQPQRILVVDGDSMVRHLSADVLIRSGYRVDAAEDGAAGWEALQGQHYHLLITEHDLPNLTGIELVRKLRAARMALPVIMATERAPVEALARKPAIHLAALLPKPFSRDQLLETVRVVLLATDPSGEQGRSGPNRRGAEPADGLRM